MVTETTNFVSAYLGRQNVTEYSPFHKIMTTSSDAAHSPLIYFKVTESPSFLLLEQAKNKLKSDFGSQYDHLKENQFEFKLTYDKIFKNLEDFFISKISTTISKNKCIHIILYSSDFKIHIVAFIERNEDPNEALVTMYKNGHIALDIFGTLDYVFKEVKGILESYKD